MAIVRTTYIEVSMPPRLAPMAQLRTLDITTEGRLALLGHAPWQLRVAVRRRILEDMQPQGRLRPPTPWQHGTARLALAHAGVMQALTRPRAMMPCSAAQAVFESVRAVAITGAAGALCSPGVATAAGLIAGAHGLARLTGNTQDNAFYCADPTHQRGLCRVLAWSIQAHRQGLAHVGAACLLAARVGIVLAQPIQVAHTHITYAITGALAAAVAVGTLAAVRTADIALRCGRRVAARSAWLIGAPKARSWARSLKRTRRTFKDPEQALAGPRAPTQRPTPVPLPLLRAEPPAPDAMHMAHMRRYITQCLMRFRRVERYRDEAEREVVQEIREGIVHDLQRGLRVGRWHEAAYRFGMGQLNDFVEITYGKA